MCVPYHLIALDKSSEVLFELGEFTRQGYTANYEIIYMQLMACIYGEILL